MSNLEQEIGSLLRQKKLTLGAVESATGGLISHLITNIPGSSDYFQGAITAYSNEIKVKIAGVSKAAIDRNGAVSHQVAEEMARGGRETLGVDICLADTGIAGPGGATPGKPSGLFYLGLSHEEKFSFQKIDAALILLEVLNVYCPNCIAQAPIFNKLYAAIGNDPLTKEKIKMISALPRSIRDLIRRDVAIL